MFLKVMEVHRDVLQRILSTILNTVMFEDCKNQWSMSRPLLGLILLNEDYFRYPRVFIKPTRVGTKRLSIYLLYSISVR